MSRDLLLLWPFGLLVAFRATDQLDWSWGWILWPAGLALGVALLCRWLTRPPVVWRDAPPSGHRIPMPPVKPPACDHLGPFRTYPIFHAPNLENVVCDQCNAVRCRSILTGEWLNDWMPRPPGDRPFFPSA